MTIYSIDGKKPVIAESAFVHPQASVIGDVRIGERVFVAPMVSIRGDRGPIEIGDETNLQDGTVVHSDPRFTTRIGTRVNIGHNATIHAESIGDNAAIGMGAVLMLGSRVAEGALIANSALLHNRTVTEPFKVYAGVPAKLMKELKAGDPARRAIDVYVNSYVENVERYKRGLVRVRD
ncbi:MAG: gamma carbonic anhydrase family protein [Candidatus Thorarchaeota archaeon]|nr:MAG: gamma carbonic anhydrase family protein [Candidatus Thorarchaeota archaeon]RLI56392.1 MAG: gamma carbonic anhydrase family protein [Candidatus Thorarchaeota archaeon]